MNLLILFMVGIIRTAFAGVQPSAKVELQNKDDTELGPVENLLTPIKTSNVIMAKGGTAIDGDTLDIDEYLENYGYLSSEKTKYLKASRVSHSEQQRKHAITLFQKFAHLPQTGEIDKKTIAKMEIPRCGFSDIGLYSKDRTKPLEFNTGPKWQNGTVLWKISSYSNKMTKAEQRLAIENSFRHWSNVSGLNAEETVGDADINIKFSTLDHGDGKANAFDGEGRILAHAFLPPDGRAHFDDDEKWVLHKTTGTEFEIVATHEIGHALGMAHSTVRGSMMSPFYKKYKPGYTLHADDIAGIQSLYGPPSSVNTTAEIHLDKMTLQLSNVSVTPAKEKMKAICTAKFDAISKGPAGKIHLFIGKKVYVLKDWCEKGVSCIEKKYPKPIRRLFKKGPKRVSAAAFVPDHRQHMYLFRGRKVWRFTGYKLDKGYPQAMAKADMPHSPTAAYIHKNQFAEYQLYIFGGKYFWELNLYTEKISIKKMKTKTYWDYMPIKPDAIVQTRDGFIYVFKGNTYNRYDYRRFPVEKNRSKAPAWISGECGYSNRLRSRD